jgi:3-hydroxy-9,10-secoandrosta-1,3,5(10)-triene-9,17-dione monooxygenase
VRFTAPAPHSLVSSDAQDAVLGADPDARLAGAFTPGVARRVDGGLRMSGRRANASGAHHATWASITATVTGDDGEVVGAVMGTVPVSELTLEDTWHTVGMRGTGSSTLVGEDVFVPEHMTMSIARLVSGTLAPPTTEALYRQPLSRRHRANRSRRRRTPGRAIRWACRSRSPRRR